MRPTFQPDRRKVQSKSIPKSGDGVQGERKSLLCACVVAVIELALLAVMVAYGMLHTAKQTQTQTVTDKNSGRASERCNETQTQPQPQALQQSLARHTHTTHTTCWPNATEESFSMKSSNSWRNWSRPALTRSRRCEIRMCSAAAFAAHPNLATKP